MGKKRKKEHFSEVKTFHNFIEPNYFLLTSSFSLKGKWNDDFFHNNNPIVLELGCGKGEYSVGLAKKYPEKNFIGIDIKGARMWRGAKTATEEGLKNVGFLRIQIQNIEFAFAPNEVSEIWITFPDPQPNKPKTRKRLTNSSFLERYRNIIKPEGLIHLKTDNESFFNYTLEVINDNNHLIVLSTKDLYKIDKELDVKEIQTFYEKIYLSQNVPIKYLCFKLNQNKTSKL